MTAKVSKKSFNSLEYINLYMLWSYDLDVIWDFVPEIKKFLAFNFRTILEGQPNFIFLAGYVEVQENKSLKTLELTFCFSCKTVVKHSANYKKCFVKQVSACFVFREATTGWTVITGMINKNFQIHLILKIN